MKWRCEWCGKPHAENDPPCDNCGHGEFEKAVVPAAPDPDDATRDAYGHVWVCTECGNDHPKNTPPCDRCGHDTFERQEIEFDQDEVMAEMLGEERSSTRSGSGSDIGYLDVVDAKLALAFVAVIGLVVVLALGVVGVVDLSQFGIGPANAGPVPGNATTAGGLDLSEVERAYLEELNARRTDAGASALTSNADVASVATSFNQDRVRAAYGDASTPDGQELRSRFGDACGEQIYVDAFESETALDTDPDAFGSEGALARHLVDASGRGPGSFVDAERDRTGVDVHLAPDGTVYVTQFVC